MKNIKVIIKYTTISPTVLKHIIFRNQMGLCFWYEIDEDTFKFSVICSREDAAWVERELAKYV